MDVNPAINIGFSMEWVMKAYGEVAEQLHSFSVSTVTGEWSASRPGRLIPLDRIPLRL